MPDPRKQPRDRWLRRRAVLRGPGRSSRLERTLVHVHAAILGVYVVVAPAPLLWAGDATPGEVAARLCLAGVFAAVAADLLARGERLVHLPVLTASLGLAIVVESVHRPGDVAPMLAYSAVAISAVRLLRLVPTAVVLLGVGVAFGALLASTPDGAPLLQYLDGALLGAALSLSIAGFVDSLENGTRTAEQLDAEALARERVLHREQGRRSAAAAVGRVLHDDVLASLRLVADVRHDHDPAVVRASCRASARAVRDEVAPLDAVTGDPAADGTPHDVAGPREDGRLPSPATLGEVLDATASRSAVAAMVEGPPRLRGLALPRASADALARAVGEALRNVLRHSGTHVATLRVVADGRAVAVEVVDEGRGLAPGTAEGFGLRQSVRATLAEVGGEVVVRPTPGGGTTVRLVLPRPAKSSPARTPAWSTAGLARTHRRTVLTSGGSISLVRAVAWPQGLAWTYLALRHSWLSPHVAVTTALLVALVVITLGVARRLEQGPPTLRWVLGLATVLVVVQVVGLATLPAGGMLDYRSWTVGFVSVPVMTVCLFLPRTLGLLVVAPHPVAVLVAVALDPALTLGLPPLGSLNATLLTPLVGVVLGVLLRRTGRQVEVERARLSQAERALARRRALAEVASVRLAHTRAVVVPWLEDVADSRIGLHAPGTADTARALSWEVRDDLYAPGFFDPPLRRVVTAARRRGAAVEVGAGFAPGAADRTTGLLLRELAPLLHPGSKLTVATRAGHARLSLVPPDLDLVQRARTLLPSGLTIDTDDFRAVIRFEDAPPNRGMATDRPTA